MVQYKLSYSENRGYAEMSRCILHYAGVEFEDQRFIQDQWPDLKAITPFGQLPVLEVDGIDKIPQSFAIARYLANKYGLAGKDDIEAAQLDAIADLQKDFLAEAMKYLRVTAGWQDGDKDKLYKDFFLPAVEQFFPMFEQLLHNSGSGFYSKSGVSWVDFFFASSLLTIKHFAPELVAGYHKLVDHLDRVHAFPQLKEYFANRKETRF